MARESFFVLSALQSNPNSLHALKLGQKEHELAALHRKLEDNAGRLGEKCGEVNVLHEKLQAAHSSNKDLCKIIKPRK